MAMQQQTAAVSAVWFVYSEGNEPLGRVYMDGDAAAPTAGAAIADGEGWRRAEIAAVRELAPTCAMRRFRVTIRPMA